MFGTWMRNNDFILKLFFDAVVRENSKNNMLTLRFGRLLMAALHWKPVQEEARTIWCA